MILSSYHEVLAPESAGHGCGRHFPGSRENRIPILVFSLGEPGALAQVLRGEGRATIIEENEAGPVS